MNKGTVLLKKVLIAVKQMTIYDYKKLFERAKNMEKIKTIDFFKPENCIGIKGSFCDIKYEKR